jgi:alpha-acetolactate decarboxylase
MKKNSTFWVGYSDLMTSLFFVMLVLYIVTFMKLKMDQGIMVKELEKLNEIENVETALSTLNQAYYEFDAVNKRYKLKMDVQFPPNSADIYELTSETRKDLYSAGKSLFDKIKTLTNSNENIEYLLVIEGNTERYKDNYKKYPDIGYKKSYERALALYNFWNSKGVDFGELNGQCEVIIAGSGYFGQSREKDESKNKRFTIQVTSKVGKFLNNQQANASK